MKLTCSKSKLVESINIVSKAIGSKTTMPILECCLLTVESDGFKLMANDTELAIETHKVEADIQKEGSVALDSKVFFDIVRRMPGSEITISVDEKRLALIKSDRSEFKILGMNPEEFPSLPEVEKINSINLPAAELKNMIRQTIFSVSQDISKPVLCGELLEIDSNYVKMVSSDGYRISLKRYGYKGDAANAEKVVIPGKTLGEVGKILPSDDESVTKIYISDKHILFETLNCTIVSRLLEGNYINYDRVFTKEGETIIVVDRTSLLESIDRASLISRDTKKSPVRLKMEEGCMVITSNTEIGAAYEEIAVEQDGPDLEIEFHPRYLSDALKVMDEQRVIMEFTTSNLPCVIKPENNEDHIYLVMPLRMRR